MKGNSFKYLVWQGMSSVWKNRVMSFASFCILMVSLLLVGFAVLLSMNITVIIGNMENKNEAVVFLKDGSTQEEITHTQDVLQNSANISRVAFCSKEDALAIMQKKESSGPATVLMEGLEASVFPDSFTISVKDLTKMKETVNEIEALDRVDYVNAPADYAKVLIGIKTTISIIGIAVLIALATVSLVIISNTTRASVFARRKEINIMKYVGATNSFIRIPFFVEGMFIGLLAAAAALFLTWFGYDSLFSLFTEDVSMWKQMGVFTIIPFEELLWKVAGCYAVAGIVLGSFGSLISVHKHLRV